VYIKESPHHKVVSRPFDQRDTIVTIVTNGFSSKLRQTGLALRSTNAMQTCDENQCAGGKHGKSIKEEPAEAEDQRMPARHCDHRDVAVKSETFCASYSLKAPPRRTFGKDSTSTRAKALAQYWLQAEKQGQVLPHHLLRHLPHLQLTAQKLP